MKCPFLEETEVKFCSAAKVQKMIVCTLGEAETERCVSAEYVICPIARQSLPETHRQQSCCPYFRESLAQYCSAAPVRKFIPYSESILSRCGGDTHQYCDLYLGVAGADISTAGSTSDIVESPEAVDGINLPERLAYSPNHMWLDVSNEGCCHIGVDDFLAKMLGQVESIQFVTIKGMQRPTVVFSRQGVDLQMVFPNPILITGPNLYLRAHPERLTADPYRQGWLFEGQKAVPHRGASGDSSPPQVEQGLFRGGEAREWMQKEIARACEFVNRYCSSLRLNGKPLMNDGGTLADDFAACLAPRELLLLFQEFFLMGQ